MDADEARKMTAQGIEDSFQRRVMDKIRNCAKMGRTRCVFYDFFSSDTRIAYLHDDDLERLEQLGYDIVTVPDKTRIDKQCFGLFETKRVREGYKYVSWEEETVDEVDS